MKPQRIVIALAPGTGYANFVRLPFRHTQFVSEFKELIPEPGRDWHPGRSAWLFRGKYLEAVRDLASRYADQEDWQVVDFTGMEATEAIRVQQELDQQEHEEHVAAVLDILPQLPERTLELAGWFPEVIILDLNEYLGEDLFTPLVRAGLPSWRYKEIPYCPAKSSKTVRVVVAADNRIVTALTTGSIQRLSVHPDLTLVSTFEDGVRHWHDADGSLWFGAPYGQMPTKSDHKVRELNRPGNTYHTVGQDGEFYLVTQAEKALQQMFFNWEYTPYLHYPEGTRAEAEYPLSAFLQWYHLVEWFRAWTAQVITGDVCERYTPLGNHRSFWENKNYWIHPAQGIVSLLRFMHEEATQEFLGWNDAYVQSQYNRIQQLKATHAANYLLYCNEHALDLVKPILAGKGKDALRKLGEQFQIPVRQSWTIARLVQELTSQGDQSEMLARAVLELPALADAPAS